jgi:hypothetical protein
MTMTNNNENCWGLNFDQSLASNNCFLYFTTDPFYLDKSGVLASSVLTLYKKRCYIGMYSGQNLYWCLCVWNLCQFY